MYLSLMNPAPLVRATLCVQTGMCLSQTMRHLTAVSQQYHPHLPICRAMPHFTAVSQQYHPYHTTCRCPHAPVAKTLKPCVGIQANLIKPCVGIQVNLLASPLPHPLDHPLGHPLPHPLDHRLNCPLDHPLPHQLEHPIPHRQDLPLERPLVTPRMPLLTPLQLCMAFPSPLNAVTAVHLA